MSGWNIMPVTAAHSGVRQENQYSKKKNSEGDGSEFEKLLLAALQKGRTA